jgi:hypothetical protein
VARWFELHELQQLCDPVLTSRFVKPTGQPELNVALDGSPRQQSWLLKSHSAALINAVRMRSVNQKLSGCR